MSGDGEGEAPPGAERREETVDALRRASRLASLLAAREWELEEARRAREDARGRWYYVLRIAEDVERSLAPVLMVMDDGPRAVAGALFQDHLADTQEVVPHADRRRSGGTHEDTDGDDMIEALLVVRATEGSRFLVGPADWPREVPMATAQVWHALGPRLRRRVLELAASQDP